MGDFFHFSFDKTFDYVFCNGAFNIREKDNYQSILFFIQKALRLAKKSIAFTLLKYSPFYVHDERMFYYQEKKIKDLLKKNQYIFTIYSDYADNDFTVIIHKKN